VLQALSLAGGVTENGAMNRVRIVRIVAGGKREIKVSLTDTVKPGDTIIVPERYF
jgi:protein involved in polysaccharide export with SLBB domain